MLLLDDDIMSESTSSATSSHCPHCSYTSLTTKRPRLAKRCWRSARPMIA